MKLSPEERKRRKEEREKERKSDIKRFPRFYFSSWGIFSDRNYLTMHIKGGDSRPVIEVVTHADDFQKDYTMPLEVDQMAKLIGALVARYNHAVEKINSTTAVAITPLVKLSLPSRGDAGE